MNAPGQRGHQGLGLRVAGRIQWFVQPALPALVDVEFGLAVAGQQQGQGHEALQGQWQDKPG